MLAMPLNDIWLSDILTNSVINLLSKKNCLSMLVYLRLKLMKKKMEIANIIKKSSLQPKYSIITTNFSTFINMW